MYSKIRLTKIWPVIYEICLKRDFYIKRELKERAYYLSELRHSHYNTLILW